MCCLKYEQDNYEQIRKQMPKVGKEVTTPDGVGVVWDLNIIKETVRVRIQKGDSSELKDFPMTEVQRVNGPQAPKPAPKAEEAPAAAAEATAEAPNAETAAPAAENAPQQPAQEQRPQRGQRPPRGERPARRNDRSGPREDKSAGRENRPQNLAKPVMRENPNRRRNDVASQEQNAPAERPVQPRRNDRSTPNQAPRKENKPAVSPWQQAVAQALRAAQGDDKDEHIMEKPIDPADHEDTYVFHDDSGEDDTI